MMTLLLWSSRHEGRGGKGTLLDIVRAVPSDAWYGIYREGRKVGFCEASLAADASSDAVLYRIDLYSTLRVPEKLAIQGEILFRDPGGLTGFSFQMRSGARMLYMSGGLSGRTMTLEYDLGGFAPPPASPLRGILPASKEKILIPLDNRRGELARLVGGEEEIIKIGGVFVAVRRYVLSSQRIRITLWVDRPGELVRAELPGEVGIVRELETIAKRI